MPRRGRSAQRGCWVSVGAGQLGNFAADDPSEQLDRSVFTHYLVGATWLALTHWVFCVGSYRTTGWSSMRGGQRRVVRHLHPVAVPRVVSVA